MVEDIREGNGCDQVKHEPCAQIVDRGVPEREVSLVHSPHDKKADEHVQEEGILVVVIGVRIVVVGVVICTVLDG